LGRVRLAAPINRYPISWAAADRDLRPTFSSGIAGPRGIRHASTLISRREVLQAQKAFGKAIKRVSKTYYAGGDYAAEAKKAAGELYVDGSTRVLFDPHNKFKEYQFRPRATQAVEYIAGSLLEGDDTIDEYGFAMEGGKGWSDVDFDNHQIEQTENLAFAVGSYYFTCAETSGITEVEYTLGYKKGEDGKPRIFLHHSSVPYDPVSAADAVISEEEVQRLQANWANAIKTISKTYLDGGDYVAAAADAAGELYGYGHTDVLFKPTKAADEQFRPTAGDAMSYFVGGEAVEGGYAEDTGFAINGGKGWSDVEFENMQTKRAGNIAIAMGNYYFTCAKTGSRTKVEYTFGYKRNEDGRNRIFLHHSSVPFDPELGAAAIVVSEGEVEKAQAAWASAIKNISKTYLDGGDYVGAAGDAAGQLYGYGHSKVLFKPTKAAEAQFRDTAADAMSYFVGHEAVEGGHAEDSGFAINGGKGWSDVRFENHQTKLTGDVAIAMGNYYFTCAQSRSETKVEYTFGYKKSEDGHLRIFLHHSSVPFEQ